MTLYYLTCFYTNDIIDLLPWQLRNDQMLYYVPLAECRPNDITLISL